MARIGIIGAFFFLCAGAAGVAAENPSESRAESAPGQASVAQRISSLREEVQKIQSEYESWAARVDRALQGLPAARYVPEDRTQVADEDRSEITRGRLEAVDAQKKPATPGQSKAVSPVARGSLSPKAGAEAKSVPSVEKKEKTGASGEKVNQKQELPRTPAGVAPNHGNVFIGVPLAPKQQNTIVYTDTSPSKGVRIMYPKVTIVGGTGSGTQ